MSSTETVRQGHDGLAALFVETIRGNVIATGHGLHPSAEDFRAFKGFRPHFRTPEGALNLRSAKEL